MAKAIPQHRVSIVTPSNDVTTIQEVDEEERVLSVIDLFAVAASKPADIAGQGSCCGSLDSFHSSCSQATKSTPNQDLEVTASLTLEAGHQPQCQQSDDKGYARSKMENESLVQSSQQCNGGLLPALTHPPLFPANYFSERRATVSALTSGVDRSPSGLRKEEHVHIVSPHRVVTRGMSASLGSNKDFSLGSHDLFPKPAGHVNGEDIRCNHRFDSEGKHQVKYGSTLTNIGVEYMRATGSIGVRFKQLQKPFSKSQDSLGNHALSTNQTENRQTDSTVVGALCTDVPLIIPMNQKTANQETKTMGRHRRRHSSHTQHHAGYRLGQRKTLAEHRRKVADYSCLFALVGLVLMVIEMECTIGGLYRKNHVPSYVLKTLITLTTIVLLFLIGVYHAIEVKLFVVDNCIEDWRITMSWLRICQIMGELIICATHPLPGAYYFRWPILDVKTLDWKAEMVPLDVVFSLPMFMRLYLIIRVMLLHSKLFTDASSRSIGALNKITFNTRFVLKTLMNIFPGTVLVVFMLSLWIICSWTLRACECWHNKLLANLLNSLYMVAITFLSVGYGDFVPLTYCGRGVSVLSGLMGAGCTALVVAVIAKKLELTRAEKHVHNFMIENQLSKKLKDAAANVLRETWLIYKYTKLVKRRVNNRRVRAHQRKFLQAINDLRTVKIKQRKLADQANSLTDFAKTTASVYEIVSDLKLSQTSYDLRMDAIERQMNALQMEIAGLPAAIGKVIADKQQTSVKYEDSQPQAERLQSRLQPRRVRHYDTNRNSFDSGP